MARFLTAADIVIVLSCPDVIGGPFQLQGFAAEDVFDTDNLAVAEVAMGVDGILSAGFVPREVVQRYTLQADSQSVDYFEAVYAQQVAQRAVYAFTGVLTLPAVGKTYNGSRGFLTGYSPTPAGRKILQPRQFAITWQSMSPGPSA